MITFCFFSFDKKNWSFPNLDNIPPLSLASVGPRTPTASPVLQNECLCWRLCSRLRRIWNIVTNYIVSCKVVLIFQTLPTGISSHYILLVVKLFLFTINVCYFVPYRISFSFYICYMLRNPSQISPSLFPTVPYYTNSALPTCEAVFTPPY